jgi:hypothetical protein
MFAGPRRIPGREGIQEYHVRWALGATPVLRSRLRLDPPSWGGGDDLVACSPQRLAHSCLTEALIDGAGP